MAITDATVQPATALALALVYRRLRGSSFVFDLLQGTYTVAVRRYASAALPAAYLIAAVGLTCLPPRVRVTMLSLIILAWLPNLATIYQADSRKAQPLSEIANAVSSDGSPSELILAHSIPSGVLASRGTPMVLRRLRPGLAN